MVDKEAYYYEGDYYQTRDNKARVEIKANIRPRYLGASIEVLATFYDEKGTEDDPDTTPAITITDGGNTSRVSSQSMSNHPDYNATWYYSYDTVSGTDEAGLWKAVVTANKDIDSVTRIIIGRCQFEVLNT